MKKLILAISIIVAGVASLCCAQTPGTVTTGPGNTAGLLYASNFGLWQVPQGNTGQFSWSSPSFCTVTAAGIPLAPVFAVGTPVFIKDQLSANSETVTPSAVNVGGAGCSLTVSPANHHNTFILASGTAGLQESINYAHGLPYQVILTPDWTRLGGTTGMITAAKGNSNVQISDQRGACITAYIWSGSAYAAQTSSCSGGGVTSINSQTGPAITLAAGSNVTVGTSGNTITINSTGGGVSQIIAGTNVTVSPTGGTGAVTINSTGGGSEGVGSIVAGANVVFSGDSILIDDSHDTLGAVITATGATCNLTGLCVITAPNTYTAGQWIDFSTDTPLFSPACLGGGPTGIRYYGTDTQLYQVLSTGLSSSQFEIQTSCNSVSGSGGPIEDATYFIPVQTVAGIGFKGINAWYLRNDLGGTACGQSTNFAAIYGDILPSVTGKPLYILEESAGVNDYFNGESYTQVEGCLQSFWEQAHAAGAYVIQNTVPPYGNTGSTFIPTINAWIVEQGKSNLNNNSGAYWAFAGVDMRNIGVFSSPTNSGLIPLVAQAWNAAVTSPGTSGFTLSGNTITPINNDLSSFVTTAATLQFCVAEPIGPNYASFCPTDIGGSGLTTSQFTINGDNNDDNFIYTTPVPGNTEIGYITAPNLNPNSTMYFNFGQNNSTGNSVRFKFEYVSNGSPANCYALGMYPATTDTFKVCADNTVKLPNLTSAPALCTSLDGSIISCSAGSSPLTTKGDIYGFGTTTARIPVGANGQTLVADSTQALGVKWATPSAATGVPTCSDTSGSGTAQVCTTSPTFTPAAGNCIVYSTTTANTGTGLTLNVNTTRASSVAKWLGTTTLAAGDVMANEPVLACYSGSIWNLSTIGNAPSGGGGGFGSGDAISVPGNASGTNSGWQNYSVVSLFKGQSLLHLSATWKIGLVFISGNAAIGNMVLLRTLSNSLSVIDSTPITIGGISNPTLTAPTLIFTDEMTLTLDRNHDYYVVIYFTSDTANASLGIPSSLGYSLFSTALGGNVTTSSTMPTMSVNQPGTAFGLFQF